MKKNQLKKFSLGQIFYHISTWTVLGLFFVSFVQQPEAGKSETEFIQKIQNQWIHLKNNYFLNGNILISKNNKVLYSDGDPHQRYMVGSLSKSFVGYYFFKNNKHLESKICNYIEKFCHAPLSNITIKNLLQHRNGFGSYFEFRHTFYKKFKLSDLDHLDISIDDFDHEKFEKLNYSNLGYDLLSRVIELIEKKQFSDIINEIAVEAGLVSTSLIRNNDSLHLSLSLPYIGCCLEIPFLNMAGRTYGSGGIVSTAQDLMRWMQFLKLKGVTHEINKIVDQKSNYNYGLVTSNSFDIVTWHNGAILGYRSLMLTTNQNLQVVILTNHIKPFKFFEDQFSIFENLFKPSKKEKK